MTLSGPHYIVIREDGSGAPPGWEEASPDLPYSVSGSGSAVTWSLTGNDGHLFHLTGSGDKLKKLEFISPNQLNYEDPLDADANNAYDVTIQATDGVGTATLNVYVYVTNLYFSDGDADEVPIILGKAQVGKTLKVDPSRVSDPGFESAPTYQWIRNDGTTDTEISGATSDSYTLTNDDLGKSVKVRMDMAIRKYQPNRRPYEGDLHPSLTSDATTTVVAATAESMVNSPATGAPTVTGTPAIYTELTSDVSGIADADGLTNVSYRYRWFINDGTSDVDYGIYYAFNGDPLRGWSESLDYHWVSSSDPDKTLGVRVTFLDDAGNWETLTSSPTPPLGPKQNSPATGEPTIKGAARVGETLTADVSSIRDANRFDSWSGRRWLGSASRIPGPGTFRYQWIRNDGASDADIAGATQSNYTLVAADLGHTVKVRVSFTDGAYYEEVLTSAATPAVAEQANRAPTVRRAMSDSTIVNGAALFRSLSGVFDDADGDSLTFTAASSDATKATAEITVTAYEGRDYSTLGVTTKARGSATITVTADDGNGGTVEDAFTVTVNAAVPMVVYALSDVSGLEKGATQDVSLSRVFIEADGDTLTITAASSDETKATVSVASDGSKLTLTGVAEGTATITVTAQDPDGNRVSDTFDVSVVQAPQLQQANRAPTVSNAISDAIIVNESGTHQASLSGVFDDADNDSLTITAESSDDAKATASVASDGSSLTVTAKARGTATITVTADDGYGGTVDDTFTVTVKAAPVVASAITDVSGLEEGATQDVSLSSAFSDADGDTLTISTTSSNEAVATVTAASDGSTLTVAGVAEGTATITATAQDSDGNRVSDAFDVSVVPEPEQQKPTLPGPVLNLQLTATTDTITVTWKAPESGDAPSRYIAHIKPEGGGQGATKRPNANKTSVTFKKLEAGTTYKVWVRAQNEAGKGERVHDSITLPEAESYQGGGGEAPPNQAPTVTSAIADATITNESGTHQASLSGVFSDADSDSLTITAASSDDAKATASVAADGSSLTVTAKAQGTVTITVTADDGNGGTVEDSFTVRVKAAPTVASAIADVTGLEEATTQDVSLSGVFSDADGDTLTVTAASSDENKATVSVASDQSKLTLTGVAEGTATITVTAQDSDGNRVSDTFDASVVQAPQLQQANRAPTVSNAIRDATIVNESGTHQVSLSGVFDDADNDSLTITAASSNEAIATASVASDGSSLTVTAKARGTATITVTADDGNGGTVEDTFTVTVKAAPTVASAIADVTGLEEAATQDVSLSGVFNDADGDTLTATAASSDENKSTASVASDASKLTLTGVAEGTATITVTAQDSDGNRVSDTFDVSVVQAPQLQQANRAPTVSNAIGDATIVNESGTHQVSLSEVFSDADNDSLTITADSSDDAKATVSVASDGSSLTVTAQARGTPTIMVTAADGNGGTVEDTFTVTVKAAPAVASAISDVSGLEENATQDVSLSGVFNDADGDTLTITAESSDETKATVSVASDNSKLTLTGVAEGTATITVTAQDSDGNRVNDAFDVSVTEAPEPEDIVARYDANGDGKIDLSEYSRAAYDYAAGKITYEEFMEVYKAYTGSG